MVPQAHHAEKIRKMQMEARRSGLVEDVIPVIEMEIRDTAKGLFGSGWEPVDIRDYCHAINAQLTPPIPKRMIDEWIAGTLEDRQNEVAPVNDKPCDHICALENEVRSWGEDFSFTFGIGPLDGSWGGIMPGEIGVLVGAQGSMKTSLAIRGILRTLREQPDSTVLVFSLDMSAAEFTARFLLQGLGVSMVELYGLIRNPTEDYLKIKKEFESFTASRLKILGNTYKKRWSIRGLEAQVGIRLPSLVVVDFLTCLKPAGQSDLECAEEVMPRIQALAQKLGTKFLLLSQMGRSSKSDQSKGAIGGHSKGGGIIEELAHSEIELLKDCGMDEDGQQRIVATITKTRRGQNGQSFALKYRGKSMEFTGSAVRVESTKTRNPLFDIADGFKK